MRIRSACLLLAVSSVGCDGAAKETSLDCDDGELLLTPDVNDLDTSACVLVPLECTSYFASACEEDETFQGCLEAICGSSEGDGGLGCAVGPGSVAYEATCGTFE